MSMSHESAVEQRTGRLFGDLWNHYDDRLFEESVSLFRKRWQANGEPADFFQGKRCLDAGCGGGRYTIAMARMGARESIGVDVGDAGLVDARRRADRLGVSGVQFCKGSVLSLPFESESFDFVCCSGVLHHTPSVEQGLGEIYRVLRPGGSVYLLLYGDGGQYWPLTLVLRPFAAMLGYAEVARCVDEAELPANKRRTVLDDLFVPVLETYSVERLQTLLQRAGFAASRRWTRGQMDHESDPHSIVAEMKIRERMWRAGARSAAAEATARVHHALADLCASGARTAGTLIAAHEANQLSHEALRAALIGTGHHRIVAQRP
jgi:ubiquinone/menaquinone biosynthesis C-methylase UbiE